jgi:leader peptidase (prepilin peptidase) / N-methyltransferase
MSVHARYPLAALGLAALVAGALLWLERGIAGLALGLAFVSVLVAVTLTDLERRVIPNRVLLAGAVVGIAILAPADPGSLPERAIAAVAAGGFLLLGAVANREGMGMGDVKLAALMGLYLGPAVVPALLVAFAGGALVGLAIIAREGARARGHALPFAPFLAVGGVVGLWAGESMVDSYLRGLG